ncbi:MAG: YdeI/OmpD-associated family protein [Polyangiaceae bacterium]|nr:YdeI/OmpD-associated family protein [Polyangiaceae bacterium]
MPEPDRRVDAYIARAPETARPILEKLRRAVHAGGPALSEDIKWGSPAFVGERIVCSLVAFKKHTAIWFHQGARLADPGGVLLPGKTVAMRAAHFTDGKQVSLRAITALVQQAVALDAHDSAAGRPRARRPPPEVPPALLAALRGNAKAKRFFASLTAGRQRDYVDWITSAKRADTVDRRIAETIARLARGQRFGEKAE